MIRDEGENTGRENPRTGRDRLREGRELADVRRDVTAEAEFSRKRAAGSLIDSGPRRRDVRVRLPRNHDDHPRCVGSIVEWLGSSSGCQVITTQEVVEFSFLKITQRSL